MAIGETRREEDSLEMERHGFVPPGSRSAPHDGTRQQKKPVLLVWISGGSAQVEGSIAKRGGWIAVLWKAIPVARPGRGARLGPSHTLDHRHWLIDGWLHVGPM